MADGWLCVSTLKQTSWPSSNRTTPALSLKTRDEPVAAQFVGRAEDRLLEQVINRPPLEGDAPP